jgi:hypothetical protein
MRIADAEDEPVAGVAKRTSVTVADVRPERREVYTGDSVCIRCKRSMAIDICHLPCLRARS